MLNTAVAESLKRYADRLEQAADFEGELHEMIRQIIRDHRRILFNGNGYDEAWIREATEQRGLSNHRTTPDCIPHLLDEKNVQMLTAHKVFSLPELRSRCEIMLENYCKTVLIEANTMVDMARRQILPAVSAYASTLAGTIAAKRAVAPSLACVYETGSLTRLSVLTDRIALKTDALEAVALELRGAADAARASCAIRDRLLPAMAELRAVADEAETLTAEAHWPFPAYGELLFGVR